MREHFTKKHNLVTHYKQMSGMKKTVPILLMLLALPLSAQKAEMTKLPVPPRLSEAVESSADPAENTGGAASDSGKRTSELPYLHYNGMIKPYTGFNGMRVSNKELRTLVNTFSDSRKHMKTSYSWGAAAITSGIVWAASFAGAAASSDDDISATSALVSICAVIAAAYTGFETIHSRKKAVEYYNAHVLNGDEPEDKTER